MVQQVKLMMFSLNMVDYPLSFLLLSNCNFLGRISRGDQFKSFMLNSPGLFGTNWVLELIGVGLVWGWAQGVLGLRVWGQGLRKTDASGLLGYRKKGLTIQ